MCVLTHIGRLFCMDQEKANALSGSPQKCASGALSGYMGAVTWVRLQGSGYMRADACELMRVS